MNDDYRLMLRDDMGRLVMEIHIPRETAEELAGKAWRYHLEDRQGRGVVFVPAEFPRSSDQ